MDQRASQDIIQQYAHKRKLRLNFTLINTMVMVLVLIGFNGRTQTVFGFPVMIVFFLAFAWIAAFYFVDLASWKCPGCKKHLGRTWNPRHCPNCGVQLLP